MSYRSILNQVGFSVFWIYVSPNLTCIDTGDCCNSHLKEMLAMFFSVVYKALILHGNLTEVGRLQMFLTELSKYLLYVYYIKLVFIFQMHQLPLQKT